MHSIYDKVILHIFIAFSKPHGYKCMFLHMHFKHIC